MSYTLPNGFNRLHPVNILVWCEHNLRYLWDRFKHIGDSQHFEIATTSKEIMSFHDLGIIVLRFGHSRITIYPGLLLYLISWLREDYDLLSRMKFYLHMVGVFVAFSFLALLVMNIERYLGAYYPIFHRTSVTRLRLLTLLAMLLIPSIVIFTISRNGLVVSAPVFLIFFMGSFFLLFIFVNFKLFSIARKVLRTVSPETRTRVNLKNISMGLWVVACLIFLSIPNSLYIALYFAEKSASTLRLSFIWAGTGNTMNCALNSLIFFWKNKVLRAEGIKILKTLKDRLVGS